MLREWDVVVIGAGGSQAQAMLRAAARDGELDSWLAVDRAWRPDTRAATEDLGAQILETDPLASPDALAELLSSTRLIANLAGPYYRTGLAILDAAMTTRTDYIDICDDADVTIPMLSRDQAAKSAGIRALVGMGSSPGTTNVLIRAAVDHLGPVEDVEICWTVDTADLTEAAIRHFWHCFNLVDPDGRIHKVASWDALERRTVDFPGAVGRQSLVRLAHPEPITIPRFLPVKRTSNFGAISPEESLVVAWSLALIADEQRTTSKGSGLTDEAARLFRHYRESRQGAKRIGSGMLIDVHTKGNGLRFSSGGEAGMDDSTGIPAAAGIKMMLSGKVPPCGVLAPELLSPAEFFSALRRVSAGGGGLMLHRLVSGTPTERLRIRDLLTPARPEAVKAS